MADRPLCPICGAASRLRYALPSRKVRNALEQYYDETLPDVVAIPDTSLYRCKFCTLEFAHPAIPGSHAFYEFLVAQPTYYSSDRWEWGVVRDLMRQATEPVALVDIGCGDGQFIEMLRELPHVRAVGLDTTASSIAKCRERKLTAYEETISEHRQRNADQRYDVVTAFHCLEHVADPSQFVEEMLALLAPGGRLLMSTPYSPMSFETIWFDPMNHPPHHMTRWNAQSYRALAQVYKLSVTFRMPRALSCSDRVALAFNLSATGPAHLQPNRAVMRRALRTPVKLCAEAFRQLSRERVNSAVAADVVLAELRRG